MDKATMWNRSGEKKVCYGSSPREIEAAANEWGADRVVFWGETWLKLFGEWVII